MKFNPFAVVFGGIPILMGFVSLVAGNPLDVYILVYFIGGAWVYWWWSR